MLPSKPLVFWKALLSRMKQIVKYAILDYLIAVNSDEMCLLCSLEMCRAGYAKARFYKKHVYHILDHSYYAKYIKKSTGPFKTLSEMLTIYNLRFRILNCRSMSCFGRGTRAC